MLFDDISKFDNTTDYLSILNGCLNADLIVLFLVFHGVFKSVYLKKWYKKYHVSAILADILILFIGIILTRFCYAYLFETFVIWKFVILAICIQIMHDVLFYWFFTSLPMGYNSILDFFKSYANEVGAGAIMGDSFTITLACLLSSNFATYSLNMNIIALVFSLYCIPYMIHYE